MKKFKIISDEVYAVRNAGYKLDRESTMHIDFDGKYEHLDYYERENMIDDLIDGFYDLDAPYLCEDEDGVLYAVYYEDNKPCIWQKVVKANANF